MNASVRRRSSQRVRLAALRGAMVTHRLDALLISSIPHIQYLTGFSGTYALLGLTSRDAALYTDPRYLLQSREEVRGIRRVITREPFAQAVMRDGLLRRRRAVGIEAAEMSFVDYRAFSKALSGRKLVPTTGLIETLMVRKDKQEIALLERAASISDRAFLLTLERVRPGVRECDLAAELSYQQTRGGGEGDAFPLIVASGPRSALPHARASSRRIRTGDLVIFDFGTRCEGYRSDITRTVGVGKISREERRMYSTVLESQRAALEAVRPGILTKDLDAVARKLLSAAGFGRYFVHSLGHGLGLGVHEGPRISPTSSEVLEEGNVITIEPGVYVRGRGGVRIEDDVAVTASGSRVLSDSPKELIIL